MELIIDPYAAKRWQEFIRTAPTNAMSIALDGYVTEGPRYNPRGPWLNFNHHAGVSRLETRATCAQVLMAIRQGLGDILIEAFQKWQGVFVYVNDCDEDVCLSAYLLENFQMAAQPINPLLNRLVFMEDMLDTTGGAYAFDTDLDSLHQLLWVFEPYHQFRASGGIYRQDAGVYRDIIGAVGERIRRYLNGKARKVLPDLRYNLIQNERAWCLVEEVGANARLGMYSDEVKAFLSHRFLPDDRHAYSLGRMSQFVPFPIPKLLKALNEAERNEWRGMVEEMPESQVWAGSDLIAGGPRGGSMLEPSEVRKIINKTLGQ